MLAGTLPPIPGSEQRPLANDRPPRADAPRARRLRAGDAYPNARSHARRLTYLDTCPDMDGSAHLDPRADVDANPYAGSYRHAYTHTCSDADSGAHTDCNANRDLYADAHTHANASVSPNSNANLNTSRHLPFRPLCDSSSYT